MYFVCEQRFIPIGKVDPKTGKAEAYRADFIPIEGALVRDMEEAKRIYGGAPILQAVKK